MAYVHVNVAYVKTLDIMRMNAVRHTLFYAKTEQQHIISLLCPTSHVTVMGVVQYFGETYRQR